MMSTKAADQEVDLGHQGVKDQGSGVDGMIGPASSLLR